jgi:hypothetical protein
MTRCWLRPGSLPIRSWADLQVLTAVAAFWNSDGGERPPYPECDLNGGDLCINMQSLAHVVRGVCDLAKLTFDRDGRVLNT